MYVVKALTNRWRLWDTVRQCTSLESMRVKSAVLELC